MTPDGAPDIACLAERASCLAPYVIYRMFERLLFRICLCLPVALLAQSPSPDVPATGPAMSPQSNTSAQAADAEVAASEAAPSPSVVPVEPPSLIPANILPPPDTLPQMPSAPELQQLNTLFKQSSLGRAADQHRLHLQMAKLETRIRNDQDLHQLNAAARRAPTDLERRHRLRTYYERYYGRLRDFAATAELKSYLTAQEAGHLLTLLQPRVRHETDEAQAAALAKKRGAGAGGVQAAPTPFQARASDAQRP